MAARDPRMQSAAGKAPEWNWHPSLPIENAPLFAWPPDPSAIGRWFWRTWGPLSERALLVLISIATWLYLQPALERCVTLEVGWIAQVYARNLLLMVLVAGGLHLYLYRFKRQGRARKYDARDLAKDSGSFTGRSQLLDNMIWSCAGGVTIWSAYEVLYLWAAANGQVPSLEWSEHPVWFALWFLVIPIFESMHFYWVHRLLHWRPLYRTVHALHHRNVNVGPWSGIAMHPVEHVLYMSSVLIHWVLPSHPIHVFFHMQWLTLGAVTSHSGFEGLLVRGKSRFALGSFHHQLHHRYFECNYGNTEMPWDKWFGSFHDGTPDATRRLRERLKTARRSARGS